MYILISLILRFMSAIFGIFFLVLLFFREGFVFPSG